ncbi:hypothetical protein PaG_00865 [Moesziomyces aphidis]|uniref:Predicted hydrolase related to dienelactone hydrolase n=2 Tax=Moesziomyces TaxID=63261 RepID=M9LKG3_PSEA3|nr:hypothetical protein PaG_00865 [Moesziomyces aphidis]GAC71931.1 predicted hydrolase related to dienelactone hydrolase [Moesziomyces antarcticus T-34]
MSSDTTAAPGSGFCVHCTSGSRIPGEPKGKIESLHGFNTYVATPASPSADSASKAIIYFYDAFGLNLVNNKIIPDLLADATGLTVYVPDMFNGGGISEAALSSAPMTAQSARSSGIVQKLKTVAAFATTTPFFVRHFPATKIGPMKKWIDELKASKGYTRLGGTGFCYGGKLVIALNGTGHIDVSVANHPSMITKGDIAGIKNPILFNVAEYDPIFSEAYAKQVEQDWAKRQDAPLHKFEYYPNTVHGFAARPDLAEKQVKDAFEKAFERSVEFWKSNL